MSARKLLDGFEGWLRETFIQHRDNVEVVRQDLLADNGVVVSRRTLQRVVQPYRQALKALATTRLEPLPSLQLQIDFGERPVEIAGANVRIHARGEGERRRPSAECRGLGGRAFRD